MSFKDSKTSRDYYNENKQIYCKRIKDRKDLIVRWFLDYKSALKCSRCPETHPACLDFHHLNGKETTVSSAVHRGWSIKRIKKEMDKCIVLCSNCHRKEHFAGFV